MLVAPLTTAVLAAAPDAQTGIASGVNNAVARTGSLLAVAAIPPIAGISGANFADPSVFGPGFSHRHRDLCRHARAVRVLAFALIRGRSVAPVTAGSRLESQLKRG